MGISIVGTGSYLPDAVLGNAELADRLGVEEQWILDKTGIKERHIAAPEVATSDLATAAAQRALDSAGLAATDIDLLVLATANPDQPIPATACFVQKNIGATRAAAFDVSAACAGFVFALGTARDMLAASDTRSTALVVGADIYSRAVDYMDKKTCVLLGDGAGAVIIQKTAGYEGILGTTLESDGAHTELAHIPAGGTRRPASRVTLAAREHYLQMRGRDVREIVNELLPRLLGNLLTSANVDIRDVNLIVPHQMNGVMLREFSDTLAIAPEAIYQTVSWSANTGAASVPIALDDAIYQKAVSEHDLILLIAFGAGLTWGGMALRWPGKIRSTFDIGARE